MRLPDPFYAAGDHIGIDLPGGRAVFTTRRGGFSSGPYESLNLGRLTDDAREAVERNRAMLARRLGVRFAYGRQVHGTRVRLLRATTDELGTPEEADGHVTPIPGVAPMVLTADCLPIAIGNGSAVAMLHAGWRGLASGIVAEGVCALRDLDRGRGLAAAIGPGAGPCCYEVGEEVHEALAATGVDARRGQNADLKAVARFQLERSGVDTVDDVGVCTICSDQALFFSHRRDRGITGRQAGVAWLS
jgi:YfiH family protein